MKSNYVDNTITTIEMCAGYGGIGLGLKNIFGERLRTIAYCELEGYAQANLISKMEKGLLDAAPIWNDLKTFPYKSFYGLVDILIAGYPCQPFSAAGKRAGKDDPRHLWPWIADGIQLLRPRMCFFENVEGHISLGLSTVISDLEELGYKVAAGLFSAAECLDASGRTAPHQRKRVFILAYDSSQRLQISNWQRTAPTGQCDAKPKCCSPSELAYLSSERLERYRAVGIEKLHESYSEKLIACGNSQNVWPSRPGEQQHGWEPPRVVNSNNNRRKREGHGANASECHEIESSMGDPIDGTSSWMGDSKLSTLCDSELAEIREWMVKCDNRTDELRLLGNGVVPATAEKAFLTLIEEINK